MRPGRARYDMNLGFQYVLALSNRGFISFQQARSASAAVLVILA
jgi:hypothetical protein